MGSRTLCCHPLNLAKATRYLPRSRAQPDFMQVSINSTVLPAAHTRCSGMNILHTPDQFKDLCELYCLPTTQLQPIMQYRHAGQHQPCLLPQDTVCPPLPSSSSLVSITRNSKANMRALRHPKYPFPGSQEPLVLPSDVCEHSVA